MKLFPAFDDKIEKAHNECRKQHILNRLDRIRKAGIFGSEQKSYIKDIIEFFVADGLIAKANELKKFAQKIDRKYLRGDDIPQHISMINRLFKTHNVFDYDNFRKLNGRGNTGWGGNSLMMEFLKRIRVCPYCNCDMIYAIELGSAGKGKKPIIKSAFDHFLPRWRFPFLALCLYNLIPSCYRCNSQLKQINYKDAMDTFHPYLDDVDDSTVFIPRNITEAVWKGHEDDEAIVISLCAQRKEHKNKTEAYNRLFGIDVVYTQLYRKEAIGIIQKAKVCPPPYMEQIDKMFAAAGILKFDPHCFLYNVPSTRQDIDRYRLAKLTLDMEEMVNCQGC